ncbi:MAG: hypothetical protein HYU56_01555 [Candidatus Aenigmarchaeota archaeon]|nr:hypothetical protein [Candidatus Aenigmarchaeota archaeon]
MKMFYLQETPFGEFFYDPESHQGVAITEVGPMIMCMAQDYNPATFPKHKECEVPDDTFFDLVDAVSRYTSGERDIRGILSRFPRTDHSSR